MVAPKVTPTPPLATPSTTEDFKFGVETETVDEDFNADGSVAAPEKQTAQDTFALVNGTIYRRDGEKITDGVKRDIFTAEISAERDAVRVGNLSPEQVAAAVHQKVGAETVSLGGVLYRKADDGLKPVDYKFTLQALKTRVGARDDVASFETDVARRDQLEKELGTGVRDTSDPKVVELDGLRQKLDKQQVALDRLHLGPLENLNGQELVERAKDTPWVKDVDGAVKKSDEGKTKLDLAQSDLERARKSNAGEVALAQQQLTDAQKEMSTARGAKKVAAGQKVEAAKANLVKAQNSNTAAVATAEKGLDAAKAEQVTADKALEAKRQEMDRAQSNPVQKTIADRTNGLVTSEAAEPLNNIYKAREREVTRTALARDAVAEQMKATTDAAKKAQFKKEYDEKAVLADKAEKEFKDFKGKLAKTDLSKPADVVDLVRNNGGSIKADGDLDKAAKKAKDDSITAKEVVEKTETEIYKAAPFVEKGVTAAVQAAEQTRAKQVQTAAELEKKDDAVRKGMAEARKAQQDKAGKYFGENDQHRQAMAQLLVTRQGQEPTSGQSLSKGATDATKGMTLQRNPKVNPDGSPLQGGDTRTARAEADAKAAKARKAAVNANDAGARVNAPRSSVS